MENRGICSGRPYGSKQPVFKSSHYSQQEATETSGEQFQPVLPSTGKVAREGRPEQARMQVPPSDSQEAVHLPAGNVLSLVKGTLGGDQPLLSDLDNIYLCIIQDDHTRPLS